MAFNFNWSPLIADTSRARDMLTSALNKSPKPPIIVDDIIVTELNLGSTPPELEILEIGDLAEDRFRGIFKMSYTGDAFLTLKTRVQANPLNTYLSTKPSFASPQPLAAASGLTIPLQITLSDIRLSGFVILVFSRQKGLTIVFRNDPLESLKVSSTFDSIPFVRDYLQTEIEGQLRVLFMEDLPAILHRLSLRMFCPEHAEHAINKETSARLAGSNEDTAPIDPLASPPQNPVDWACGDGDAVPFSLEETHATFSQKNLIRLAALTESHRTLSLFTPSVQDSVFRAWAGAASGDYGERTEAYPPSLAAPSLSRVANSRLGSPSTAMSLSSGYASESDATSTRPSLVSFGSSSYGLSMGSSRARGASQRKRKKRVINLRKNTVGGESINDGSRTTTLTPAPSVLASSAPSVIIEEPDGERDDELITPPLTPNTRVRFRSGGDSIGDDFEATPRFILGTSLHRSPNRSPRRDPSKSDHDPPPLYESSRAVSISTLTSDSKHPHLRLSPIHATTSHTYAPLYPHPHHHTSFSLTSPVFPSNYPSTSPLFRSFSNSSMASASASASGGSAGEEQWLNPFSGSSGGVLEQAWMNRMAAEIARKVREERAAGQRYGGKGGTVRARPGREAEMMGMPPPAYGS